VQCEGGELRAGQFGEPGNPTALVERQGPGECNQWRAQHDQRRRHQHQQQVLDHVGREQVVRNGVEGRLDGNYQREQPNVKGGSLPATHTPAAAGTRPERSNAARVHRSPERGRDQDQHGFRRKFGKPSATMTTPKKTLSALLAPPRNRIPEAVWST
jgi:hypothetical protein